MRDLGILLEKAEVLGKITNTQKQQLVSLAVRRVLERAEAEALFLAGRPLEQCFDDRLGRTALRHPRAGREKLRGVHLGAGKEF